MRTDRTKRLRLIPSLLLPALLLAGAPAFAPGVAPARADDIAHPHDPLRFKSQDELIRSFRSIVHLFREIPSDVYRCVGLMHKDGWTGEIVRKNPSVVAALDQLFAHRTSNRKSFEKLCFINQDADYVGIIENDLGMCAGITTMNWIANYLALFDETGEHFRLFHPERRLPRGHTTDSFQKLLEKKAKEWEQVELRQAKLAEEAGEDFYPAAKTKLDREDKTILNFYVPFINRLFREKKPTVFPYFPTIEALSAHPSIKAYLLKLSVETWHHVNVSLSSAYEILLAGGSGNVFNLAQLNRLDERVKAYLKLKIQPIIFIHLPARAGVDKSVHILRVISTRWEKGGDRYAIRVVDPNFEKDADVHRLVVDKVKTRPEKLQAIYEPYREDQVRGFKRPRVYSLTDVEIAPFFDLLSHDAMKAWRDWIAEEGDDILTRLQATAERRPPVPAKRAKPKPSAG